MLRLIAIGGMAAALFSAGSGAARAAGPPVERHGPYCTPTGCAGEPQPSPATAAVAFAGAAFASGALARRRRPRA